MKRAPLRRLKAATVWVVAAMIVGTVLLGAFTLSTPVPSESHRQCLEAAKQSGDKHPHCPEYETIFSRGLADPVAYYSLWLALFTGVLAVVAVGQGYMLNQQIRLARDEFIATHRPRLRVRAIQTDGIMRGAIFVLVVNVGESPAEITKIKGYLVQRTAKWIGEPPNFRDGKAPDEESRYFAAGQKHSFLIGNGWPESNDDRIEINRRTRTLFVVGEILYIDGAGIERTTGFCWPFEPNGCQFVNPEKASEYNYED